MSGYVKKPRENHLPPGRKPGAKNKSSALAKEAIARFVDANSHRITNWLIAIEKEHGALAAYNAFWRAAEYHVPKLARTEVTGKDDGPVEISITWQSGK